jgi:hypothetical protein
VRRKAAVSDKTAPIQAAFSGPSVRAIHEGELDPAVQNQVAEINAGRHHHQKTAVSEARPQVGQGGVEPGTKGTHRGEVGPLKSER